MTFHFSLIDRGFQIMFNQSATRVSLVAVMYRIILVTGKK